MLPDLEGGGEDRPYPCRLLAMHLASRAPVFSPKGRKESLGIEVSPGFNSPDQYSCTL